MMQDTLTRGSADLLRSSRVMAVGTLTSRITGFARTVVIAVAIGTVVGDAYNTANTIPNIVYELLLGGILTSVVVPLLVAAGRHDDDNGEAYAQRLLTVAVVGLLFVSVLAVVLAPWIIRLYVSGHHPARLHLATTFARYFLPQIFFYGIGALLGAILNVRDRFAAPMWAPIVNNAVVIVTGALFIAVTTSSHVRAGQLSSGQTALLGIGTTVGIVAQTVALIPSLRRTGFRLKLRTDLRGHELRAAARLAGWIVLYVAANQVAFLVITRLAYASGYVGAFSAYTYAFILVSLPHAVVAVSVITALLPQMSRSAIDWRLDEVARDLARGFKLAAVILVPAALGGIVFGPLIGGVLFSHLTLAPSFGRLTGATLGAYAVSLVPFSGFQLQLRAFYALRDTRTPALVNLAVNAINLVADVVLFVILPPRERVVGLALGYSLSYLAGFIWFSVLLRHRLGRVPDEYVTRTLVRLAAAGGLAAATGYGVAHAITTAAGLGTGASLLALLAGAAVGVAAFVWLIRRMRVPEVAAIASLARSRLGG